MISRITNVSITKRAELALDRERARVRLGEGQVFALAYLTSFTNPDGTTVAGFRPGYMATAYPSGAPDAAWTVAHLAGGQEFYLMPTRFECQANETYVVDLIGSLFSIERQI